MRIKTASRRPQMITKMNNSNQPATRCFGKKVSLLPFALLLALLCLPGFNAAAQTGREQVRVFFPWDDATLRPDYMTNPVQLAKLDSVVRAHAFAYSAIDSVYVVSKSSPEGVYNYNVRLSERRAASMKKYLVTHYPELADKIREVADGESWAEFRESVVNDTEIAESSRERMLEIIDSDASPDRKEALLKSLPTWRRFYRQYFPTFRFSAMELVFFIPDHYIADLPDENYVDPIQLVDNEIVVPPLTPRSKVMIAALETNLLFDAATMLNFAIEVPIADRWSVLVEDVFPWWEKGNKYCLQMWEIGAEARYWFKPWDPRGTEKLRGWFAGLYGMTSKYDFQNDKQVNYQGEYWSAGLTGGYSLPLGRKKWGNLELSLGLGYLNTQFRHYQPTDTYSKLIHDRFNDGKASYFGPTKAKVSLVIPIIVPSTYKSTTKKEVSHE